MEIRVTRRFAAHSLQVLYLHGNLVSGTNEVKHLSGLQSLQKLTLHGNPVAEKHNYKM
jgi:hypothetical protein